jgi:hypothetical protein
VLGLFMLVTLLLSAGARAQDSVAAGNGESYWGPILPVADSLTTTSTARGMPLWEATLVWPFRVITFPIVVVGTGIAAGVEVLDESKIVPWIAERLRPRPGPLGVHADFTAGGLTGLGAAITGEYTGLFGPTNRGRLAGGTSTTGHRRVNAGVSFQAGARGRLELAAGYRMRPNARYFGLGPGTSPDDESFYRQESAWGGGSYTHTFGLVEATGEIFWSSVGTRGPPDEDDPPLPEQFAGSIPTGFGEYSTGVSVGLGLAHVELDRSGRATRGGARRARVWHFSNRDESDLDFWTFRLEAEQLVPLWYRYHTLALRGVVAWIDITTTDAVPFQRLMTNRTPDALRGFDSFRWRDRGIVILSAEYRWPIWANKNAEAIGLDFYLLGDVGQVFRNADDIGGSNLTTSIGAGVRLGNVAGLLARLELAWSEEGVQLRLQSDHMFQFFKRSLYHGREPSAHR